MGVLAANAKEWTGTKWWPGRYTGDDKLHEFKVGVIADVDAFEEHGDETLPGIETMFAESNFIYEHQLNVKLSIGTVDIYETESGAPNYAVGCTGHVQQKLQDLRQADVPF